MEHVTTRFLRWAGLAFGLGFGIHGLDHLRRGFDASPDAVMVIGSIQGAFVLLAVAMAWRAHRHAGIAAILVGVASVLLVTFGHLLPASSEDFSDSFVTPPSTNVNVCSWVSAWLEIATAVAFAAAGLFATVRPSARARAGARG